MSTAFWLGVGLVSAVIDELSIPAILKPGDVFIANGTSPIMQPSQYAIVWAITSWSTPGEIGDWGHIVGITDLRKDIKGQYWVEIGGLSVPHDFPAGPASVKAIFTESLGAAGSIRLSTRTWNVTVGEITSEERVTVGRGGVGAAVCDQLHGVGF
ncbi:hypothetical protein B0H67DRAFT_642477 [Lasiosphaeris hirsuta]|uniref:Uncharacterized protein n=1 Tax=Lasiosphaeris hirsuta TaxID=260670 RepID=A0AA40B1W7_9PEZI|nr:hypothetical protein B0H67DRAFT_642477 [Lasiosphaeris hirsuta]